MNTQPISIQFHNQFGRSRTDTIIALQEVFYLPLHHQDTLETYQLLFWNKQYFLSEVQDGFLFRNGVKYQVIYNTPRGQILVSPASQVKLSFRKPMKQVDFLRREEERVVRNRKLAALRKTESSCFSCRHYIAMSPFLSKCKKSGKVVKFYNICEKHSVKE
jgi:hypothetical protein